MKDIQVYVIGRLGELAKKVVELELMLETQPNNEVAVLELASYSQVLTAWPVEDPDNATLLVHDLRIAIRKYIQANEDFVQSLVSRNHIRLDIDGVAYTTKRDAVKAKVKHLNALGRYVGHVPLMSLTVQGEQNADSQSS